MRFCLVVFILLSLTAPLCAGDSKLEAAYSAYNRTDYWSSIGLLDQKSRDPEVLVLLGKNYYMLGFEKSGYYNQSTDFLEKATKIDSTKADYYLWLARAYGRKAETSIFFKAIGPAKKTKAAFEKAYELDPSNIEIMMALFQYYLDAPGYLGGGTDKAMALAAKIAAKNTAEGERAQALLSAKRKDLASAGAHLLKACELEPRNVDMANDAAAFFREQKRYGEAEEFLKKSDSILPNNPRGMLERARLYMETNRRGEAKELLLRYNDPRQTPLTPDDPPRVEAEKLLDKLH